jgi:hypothetical protein
LAVTGQIKGTISLTDNLTGSTSFSKVLNAAYAGTLSEYAQSFSVLSTGTVISVPNGSAQLLYIKNLASTSGQNISVTWTPTGASSETVLTLSPGSIIIFSEADAVNGISNLTLTATGTTTVGTTVEFLLVG